MPTKSISTNRQVSPLIRAETKYHAAISARRGLEASRLSDRREDVRAVRVEEVMLRRLKSRVYVHN